jgi:hypothetical protein
MPDEMAQQMAGIAGNAAKTALDGLAESDKPATPASTAPAGSTSTAAPPRGGLELLAHVLEIKNRLTAAEDAWVTDKMTRHRHLLDELKSLVASMTLDEGAAAVRQLMAVEQGLPEEDRIHFDRSVAQPNGAYTILQLIGGRPAPQAVALVQKAFNRTLTRADLGDVD